MSKYYRKIQLKYHKISNNYMDHNVSQVIRYTLVIQNNVIMLPKI